jgi:ABC-type transporter Mla maintaining outer membrane lipid asymmetry permease subunit MlaE
MKVTMATDKKYHVLAGLLVAAFVGLPCYLESLNLFAGLWPAIVSGIIAGGVKEYCDMRTDGNKFDWKDFLATCLGAVIVTVFIVGLHYGKG